MDQEEAMIKSLTTLQFLNATMDLRAKENWTLRDVLALAKSIISTHCLHENMSLHEMTEVLMEFHKDYQMLIERQEINGYDSLCE